jgi:hypothetical protein
VRDVVVHGDLVGIGVDGHVGGLAGVRETDLDALPAGHDRAADRHRPFHRRL